MQSNNSLRRVALPGLLLTLGATLVIAGCKQPEAGGGSGNGAADIGAIDKAKPYEGSTIVLGEYGSLTGNDATFGKSTENGIQMAIDEINAGPDKGVLGKKIEVQPEDDASEAAQAATVVKKLITQDNVLAILGEVASSRSLAAAPICQTAGVPMISPTSTNPAVTQKGDYIFRTCYIDPFQGPVLARFAAKNLKAKTAAMFKDSKNDYSIGLAAAIEGEFAKTGKIVEEASYSAGDTDFRSQLTEIKASNPDIIFIPGYYADVANIAVQAKTLGITTPMMGGDGWDSADLYKIGGAAVNGNYFSTHYSSESKDPRIVKFVTDYKGRYGEVPDALAAVAYDAARIMCAAIKRAGSTDRAKIRDAIAATKNFPGVTGNITIDKDRNASKPIVIVQIRDDKPHYITTINP